MAQKIILPTCRLRLDSVEDQEYDLANTPEEEVDEIDFHSVNTNTTEGLYNFNNVGESPLLNPQPLTSILNSLIHDDEDTLITKADIHHAISSRLVLILFWIMPSWVRYPKEKACFQS